ncbi:MAG: hypothetical protein ACLFRV_09370, partial [Acidimicrobiales bacterium]
PVAAEVEVASDGGLDAVIDLAEPDSLEPTGAAPKAISRSGLHVDVGPAGARCSLLVESTTASTSL